MDELDTRPALEQMVREVLRMSDEELVAAPRVAETALSIAQERVADGRWSWQQFGFSKTRARRLMRALRKTHVQ